MASIHLSRSNSICPSPEEALLLAVKKNNPEEIEDLLKTHPKLINHKYPGECHRTILLISVLNRGTEPKTIETLLKHQPDVKYSTELDLHLTALHCAVNENKVDVLKLIIASNKEAVNVLDKHGNNALHLFVKYFEPDRSTDCAKILIENGLNVNQRDNNSRTPIYYAVQKEYREVIKVILDNATVNVDLTLVIKNKTLQEIIEEKNLYDLTTLNLREQNLTNVEKLFRFDNKNDLDKFKALISEDLTLLDRDNGAVTILQNCVKKGLVEHVKFLIEAGADVTSTTKQEPDQAIEIATKDGNFEMFALLLKKHSTNIKVPNSVILELAKNINSTEIITPSYIKSYRKCYDKLISELQGGKVTLDVNYVKSDKNNALHYLTRYGTDSDVLNLLDFGANLGIRNQFGFLPVEDIDADVLETHLNNCITYKNSDNEMEDAELLVNFNWETLIPLPEEPILSSSVSEASYQHNSEETKLQVEDLSRSINNNVYNLKQTDVILFLSESKKHRHLLMHPVIVAFLLLKWHKIRWLFRVNVTFYITFMVALIAYILCSYANFNDEENINKVLLYASLTVLVISVVILFLRELFQFVVTPLSYLHWKNYENYIEICLIILTTSIIFISSPNVDTRKQLSSIVILLAGLELFILIGHHPKLSTNVEILKTVSCNFFKLLLWYSVLIITFVLSFHILLMNEQANDEENAFQDTGKSFFKTIVMLTGEFDASAITFTSILSRVVFCLFIFVITIILLNLLNGLAVSDTQMIKNDAELVGHIATARHINYVEKMFLGNLWPTKALRGLFCCFPSPTIELRFLAEKCALSSLRVDLFLNTGWFRFSDKEVDSCVNCETSLYLDSDTLGRTKAILKERSKMSKGCSFDQEFRDNVLRVFGEFIKKNSGTD